MEEYIGAPGASDTLNSELSSNNISKTTNNYDYINYSVKLRDDILAKDSFKFGKKESNGKLFYELDFDFIKQMAERMSENKGKYTPYNWKKPLDIEEIKQATFRHVLEIMEGRYEDDGRLFGHLEAIAVNAMFINYQLKNNDKVE